MTRHSKNLFGCAKYKASHAVLAPSAYAAASIAARWFPVPTAAIARPAGIDWSPPRNRMRPSNAVPL